MSLNSLATSYVARDRPLGMRRSAAPAASDDAVGPADADVQNALSALVEYVPAETVTLYLATIASLPVISRGVPGFTAWGAYALFAVLTPVLFALIYGGKRRAAGKPRWPGLGRWPWWPMVAATVAFLAWGLAVPDGPALTRDAESGRTVASLLAILVSVLLGVAGRFFGPSYGST
jgi:hypothetical protein